MPETSLPCIQLWSGRRESNPRPTAWKAVTLPLSYSRSNCPAFSISEVLRCAQDLGGGLKRPPIASTWKGCDSTTELLPLNPAFSISEVLRCAQDLGGGLKRPPIASTWKAVTLPLSYYRPYCHFTLARSLPPPRISAAGSRFAHARKTPQVTPAKTSHRLSAVSSQ